MHYALYMYKQYMGAATHIIKRYILLYMYKTIYILSTHHTANLPQTVEADEDVAQKRKIASTLSTRLAGAEEPRAEG